MTISVFFSSIVYHTSMNELDRSLRRPTTVLNGPIGPGFSEHIRQQLIDERTEQYNEARDHIIGQLIVINLFILAGGGALSYYLALRTLKPIEEAHEAKSRFTADASHELRTPITAMMTENEVALMNPKLTLAEAKEQLHSNIEELQKLTALSEGLLRLAQIDNNHLTKNAVPAKDILHAAVTRVLPLAEKRNILINSEYKSESSVYVDEASATEALVILIDNAIKYSPEKSEIEVTLTGDQRSVSFTVKDKGSGIQAAELPYIFDRFYRADTSRTKQQTQGYGLGLAIAKSIVDAHGGNITVKSKPGKGSSFSFSLPAVNA